MKTLKILWEFSRPHTVIGSTISIITLYMIICENNRMEHLPLLLSALTIGITCNVFIVGINQVADVHLDTINKPYLPIPARALSMKEAKSITYNSLLISLALALYISHYLFYIILLSAAIGWAYSMPPFHLKKHHFTAALSISIVRGILINIGGFMVFNYQVNKSVYLPDNVKILTAFILIFSIVISWFKDLPDIKGDSIYRIKTLAIVYSPRLAFISGNLLIILTYLLTIIIKYLDFTVASSPPLQTKVLLFGHIFLLVLFVANSFTITLSRSESVKKFYKRFWWFFFAEYLLYLIAYI